MSHTNKMNVMVIRGAQRGTETQETAINRRTPVSVIGLTRRSVLPVAPFASLTVKSRLSFKQVLFLLCV